MQAEPEWLKWLSINPIHRKVAGSIPGQGTYLSCEFSLYGRQPIDVSLTVCVCLSLSSSL